MDPKRTQYVSHIGEGLHDIAEVPELHNNTSVKSLNLHSNTIQRIAGLGHLVNLTSLNLSSNSIRVIENLSHLVHLTSLNIASNCIVELKGLAGLSHLQQLNVSYNALTSIAGVTDLHGSNGSLRKLNLQRNNLRILQSLAPLAGCLQLQQLKVGGNPCTLSQAAYAALQQVLPQVLQWDESEAVSIAVGLQMAHAQLQAFQHNAQQLQQPERSPPQQHSSRAAKKQARETQQDPKHLPQARARPPWHEHKTASQAPGPQALNNTNSGDDSSSLDAQSSADMPDVDQPDGKQQLQQQLAQPYEGQHGVALSKESQKQHRLHRNGNTSRAAAASEAASRPQAAVTEAGAQTDAYTPPEVQLLRTQAQLLQEQLSQLADELDKSRALEAQLRGQMCDAIRAAEAEACKKVEDSYQEASFAVAKALEQLDLSVKQAAAAEQHGEQMEHELCQVNHALQQAHAEIARLREQQQQAGMKLEQQQAAAAKAVAEECERHVNAEIGLQQQVQQLKSDLAVAQAAAHNAELQVASLEAALQKGSEVTLSMTEKVAQALAAANAQVEALKVQLANSDTQVAAAHRATAAAQAEAQSARDSLAAAHQERKEEVAVLRQQQETVLHQVRSQAGAELAELHDTLDAVSGNKAALSEQLAVLKTQLCFVLQESDREMQELQQQLKAATSERNSLQAAAEAATARQQEHERLVSDLTHAVQQQKAQLQAMQRDKDDLTRQLHRCTPAEFDRLHNELLLAKRQAAELVIVQEQLTRHKQLWSEAEQRLAQLQATTVRRQEEATAKQASLAAQLKASEEELAAAQQQNKQLQQQLADTQDAVKVKAAMIDDANATITQLKEELSDVQQELDKARQDAKEATQAASWANETAASELEALRAEVAAGETAIQQLEKAIAAAQARADAAEAKARAVQEAAAEKDNMIKFVEQEVERVKVLFDQKESRLKSERDAAQQQLQDAKADRISLAEQVQEQKAELALMKSRLEQQRQAAAQSAAAAAAAQEAAAVAEAEASVQLARVAEVEHEMAQLLTAVEAQKACSAQKRRQLASLLQEL